MSGFWDDYVEKPRCAAYAIQDHASPGNWEAQLAFEVYMRQAEVSEQVLRQWHEKLADTPQLQVLLGVPSA